MRVKVRVQAVTKVGSIPFEHERETTDNYDAVMAALNICYREIWSVSRAQGFDARELVYSTYINGVE